jgi:hypothetical protein
VLEPPPDNSSHASTLKSSIKKVIDILSIPSTPTSLTNTKFQSLIFLQHQQTLQRASSVPTRSSISEIISPHPPHQPHEQTQSQQQSIENQLEPPPLTPSTTEESVVTAPISSMEPLLLSGTTGSNNTNNTNIKLEVNGQQTLPNLPGIIPVQGHLHSSGWL